MQSEPPTPLDQPAAWRGAELEGRHDWRDTWEATTPNRIRERLEAGPGVLLLKGFPLTSLSQAEARQRFGEWCGALGHLLSQNEKGETLFDVSDAGLGQNDPRTRGPNTNRKLSFHTDRCDVIGFLCWRQAREGGENEIVSSPMLYNEIARRRPDLLSVLLESFPYKRHTVDLGNQQPWCEQPIFSFQENQFACSFLRVLIDRADADPDLPDLTDEQREAMDLLEAIAAEPGMACAFRQEPGDILLLNNWVTLHRRSAFVDGDDPEEKRCLFRAWLSMPNSRPLDPRFKANFGATEAGAIRGGFQQATARQPES